LSSSSTHDLHPGGRLIDEVLVAIVTISPKFQVVIPKRIRVAMRLKPGQKLAVFRYADRIELVPVRPIREMRGFLRGIDTTVERDADRA
jgi:AbrB family looped-hinge helix DNA binding protein